MIAAIIIIAFEILGLGVHLAKHNEPRINNYNFWYKLISFIIDMVLLYFAGIFNNFK